MNQPEREFELAPLAVNVAFAGDVFGLARSIYNGTDEWKETRPRGGRGAALDLVTFGLVGRLSATRGTESLFRSAAGSPDGAEVAALAVLLGVRVAMLEVAPGHPLTVNCPPDFFDLYVVDDAPRGVWVSTSGNTNKLRARREEWIAALDAALGQLRNDLVEELPELGEDTELSEWLNTGVFPPIAYVLADFRGV